VIALRRPATAIALATLLTVGCGADDPAVGVASDIPSCTSGAASVISFLQRTLDDVGDADTRELAAYRDRFDFGVDGLLQRAQEMHCTEVGFNDAVIARVGELEPNGPAGQALIDRVAEIGLGSLDPSRGGPLTLPGD
jgi:hypothetical protein